MAESELVIIGAGVGGYGAAIRATQPGLAVTLVERRPTIRGKKAARQRYLLETRAERMAAAASKTLNPIKVSKKGK